MRSHGNIQARPVPRLYIRPRYGDPFFNTPAEVRAAFASGAYELVVVDGGSWRDEAAVSAGIESGAYLSVVVPENAPTNSGALAAEMGAGTYMLVVVDGGSVDAGAAAVEAAISSGAYTLVIIPFTAVTVEGTVSASFSSGSYVHA